MLENIKMLLAITDDSQDNLINYYIDLCVQTLLNMVKLEELPEQLNFVVERKANIDELANNLKDDAARLKKELAHLNKYNIEFYIFLLFFC